VTVMYEVRSSGNRMVNAALGGWRSGCWRRRNRTTFTVIYGANTTNAFPAGALRPNLLRNAEVGSADGGRCSTRRLMRILWR